MKIKLPENGQELREAAGNVLFALSKIHIWSAVVGGIVAILVQALTGFWSFRENHQATITKQYQSVIEADGLFELQRQAFEEVFRGQPIRTVAVTVEGTSTNEVSYRQAAQSYIGELTVLTSLLDNTNSAYLDLVDAIAQLSAYYNDENPPDPDLQPTEWTVFYGRYRQDFDQYMIARERYLSETAGQAGNYWRYLWNS